MSLKLLTGKLKSVMHDASHSLKPRISKIQIILFPSPILLRMSMFLILLNMMGLATIMSIQISLMHLSPKISQLTCPYLTMPVGPLNDVSRLERYCTDVLLARLTKVRR
jgi:hypothetical protein